MTLKATVLLTLKLLDCGIGTVLELVKQELPMLLTELEETLLVKPCFLVHFLYFLHIRDI